MSDIDIIRWNIDHFRRLLQSDLDPAVRRTVEELLSQFETKLSLANAALNGARIDPHQT